MRLRVKTPQFLKKTLECTHCETIRVIPRRPNRNRPVGHHKVMFCPVCNKVRSFKELD